MFQLCIPLYKQPSRQLIIKPHELMLPYQIQYHKTDTCESDLCAQTDTQNVVYNTIMWETGSTRTSCMCSSQSGVCALVCHFGHMSCVCAQCVKGHCVGGHQVVWGNQWVVVLKRDMTGKIAKAKKKVSNVQILVPVRVRLPCLGPCMNAHIYNILCPSTLTSRCNTHTHTRSQPHSLEASWMQINRGGRGVKGICLARTETTGLFLCGCQGSEVMATMSQNMHAQQQQLGCNISA